ncbi:hypothetical protein V1286_005659 [Bradyrhizobium algeriense]|jgi:hypothetical protein|uniref:Uncharacterized protein n=1 Tax=Bradyrhizobium algeriense TaxID=634784 RepID=A0ABU8BHW7_9BRAD
MGALMAEDDIYIGTLMEQFNLRFGLSQTEQGFSGGGNNEIAVLQSEFGIFRADRTFAQSARLLGLGGLQNNRAKNRWFSLLDVLPRLGSDKAGETGDQRIVKALMANFGDGGKLLPCFMKAHDSRGQYGPIVIVTEPDRPIFYIEKDYLTISLPMKPGGQPA